MIIVCPINSSFNTVTYSFKIRGIYFIHRMTYNSNIIYINYHPIEKLIISVNDLLYRLFRLFKIVFDYFFAFCYPWITNLLFFFVLMTTMSIYNFIIIMACNRPMNMQDILLWDIIYLL